MPAISATVPPEMPGTASALPIRIPTTKTFADARNVDKDSVAILNPEDVSPFGVGTAFSSTGSCKLFLFSC